MKKISLHKPKDCIILDNNQKEFSERSLTEKEVDEIADKMAKEIENGEWDSLEEW